jgi:hypothetical protein
MSRVSKREAEVAVASARSKPDVILYVGALLGRATGEIVVIVGGSAIEIYTSGQTSSADIDVVAPREGSAQALAEWGFQRAGRIWRREDWGIDVDLRGPNLIGSRERTLLVETPYGPVRILGVEDLLIKRLVELKYWPTSPGWREDLEHQVEILLAEYGDRFDESYLAFLARRDGVVDILAGYRGMTARAIPVPGE